MREDCAGGRKWGLRVGVFQVLGRNVLALRQLEHVFDAVHNLQGAARRQLANIPRVEEPVLICTTTHLMYIFGYVAVNKHAGRAGHWAWRRVQPDTHRPTTASSKSMSLCGSKQACATFKHSIWQQHG